MNTFLKVFLSGLFVLFAAALYLAAYIESTPWTVFYGVLFLSVLSELRQS